MWGVITMGLPQWLSGEESPAMQEMQETQVQSLGQEDSLEEGMATHSSILAWRNPWAEEPGRLQSMLLQRVRHDWAHTQQAYHHYSYFWYVIE